MLDVCIADLIYWCKTGHHNGCVKWLQFVDLWLYLVDGILASAVVSYHPGMPNWTMLLGCIQIYTHIAHQRLSAWCPFRNNTSKNGWVYHSSLRVGFSGCPIFLQPLLDQWVWIRGLCQSMICTVGNQVLITVQPKIAKVAMNPFCGMVYAQRALCMINILRLEFTKIPFQIHATSNLL